MSMRWRMTLMMIAVSLAGCGVGEGTGSTPPWAAPDTPTAPALAGDESTDDEPVDAIDPYRVRMTTTKGDVVIAVNPQWAPHGAIRFKQLVEAGYYDDNRIFRVVKGFVVQFGMHGDPKTNADWEGQTIPDDRVKESNKRGLVTFATSGTDARTTQIFINLSDNGTLDTHPNNFAPFGEVVEGLDVADAFNGKYGEPPSDTQQKISAGGNAYLDEKFPGLDSIVKATVISDPTAAESEDTTSAGGTDND